MTPQMAGVWLDKHQYSSPANGNGSPCTSVRENGSEALIRILSLLVKNTMLRAPEASGNALPDASTGDFRFSSNGEYYFGSDKLSSLGIRRPSASTMVTPERLRVRLSGTTQARIVSSCSCEILP